MSLARCERRIPDHQEVVGLRTDDSEGMVRALHYGSDYPFTPELGTAMAAERLEAAGDPPGSLVEALRANTLRLFPALGATRS